MQLIAARLLQRYGPILPSVALFAVCLVNDGYYIDGPDPRAWAPAWGLLLFGWVGVFTGTVAWFANPVLFLAWITLPCAPYSKDHAVNANTLGRSSPKEAKYDPLLEHTIR